MRRWLPTCELVVVGDNSYAVLDLLHACQQLANPVTLVARLRLDAALYEPAPPYAGMGRPRKKGSRLPTLEALLKADTTPWTQMTLTWYQGTRLMEIASHTAVWYHTGKPPIPERVVLNAIWYVLWTGCQWKALQREWFGVSASTAHARMQLWQEIGIFRAILLEMVKFYHKRRKIGWKWQAIDGKNCPAPLGGEHTGRNPTDRGKRGSKLHILVDKRGAPLSIEISAANCHDKCLLEEVVLSIVVERPASEQHFCADRGYDSRDIKDFLELEHYVPHIQHRRRRGEPKLELCPIPGETQHPARRWVVERTFSWLAKRRSLRTRWTKKAANWLALVQLAAAPILFDMAFFG